MAWAVPAVLILGLGALGTGISNASSNEDAVNGVDAAACQALEEQIIAGQEVDAAAAIECDQVEFDALAEAREDALALGQNVALENSSICEAVNERAAQFDPRLALELALTCQQQELIVNKVNGVRQLSSLSQGVQAQKLRGGQVAPYLEQFCRDEAVALADVDLLENAYEDVAADAYANDEADYADADANLDAYDYEDAARAAEEYAEADDNDNGNANQVEVDVDVDIEAGTNGSYDANEVRVDVDVNIDVDSDGGDDEDDQDKDDDEDDNDDEINTEVKVDVEVK